MSSARRGSLGAERERHETTAAHAQAEAPTAAIAHEVEENVEQAKEAAEEVAEIARAMGTEMTGEPESTFDVLQREAAEKTKEAVAEGQKDVHSAKETGASYLDQAKSMAESVLASAQEFRDRSRQLQELQWGLRRSIWLPHKRPFNLKSRGRVLPWSRTLLGMGTQPEGEGVTPPASMTTASEEKSSTAGQAEPKVKSDVA